MRPGVAGTSDSASANSGWLRLSTRHAATTSPVQARSMSARLFGADRNGPRGLRFETAPTGLKVIKRSIQQTAPHTEARTLPAAKAPARTAAAKTRRFAVRSSAG